MNLEELVRDALADQGKVEPSEAGAYDRFRRHRVRSISRMSVAVMLTVVAGLALPQVLPSQHRVTNHPRPVPNSGIVRVPGQGYELQVPAAWQVDEQTTRRFRQVGEDRLVLQPVDPARRGAISVYADTLDPQQYPDRLTRPDKSLDGPGGLVFARLSGRISHGRRADGRGVVVAKQDLIWTYAIAWRFHCPKDVTCPAEASLRALLVVVDADQAFWPGAIAAAARIVATVRPIGNAVTAQPATGLSGLPVSPTIRVASGGRGRDAWTLDANQRFGRNGGVGLLMRFPNDPSGLQDDTSLRRADPRLGGQPNSGFDGRLYTQGECLDRWPDPYTGPHARTALLWGATAKQAHSVRIDLAGAAAVEVTVVGQDKPLPYNFFVSPPLPPDAHVRQVQALDAGGRVLGRAAFWGRFRTLCVKPGSAIWG